MNEPKGTTHHVHIGPLTSPKPNVGWLFWFLSWMLFASGTFVNYGIGVALMLSGGFALATAIASGLGLRFDDDNA